MPQRIWKRVAGDLVGFGNGHRAIMYETAGFPDHGVDPIWTAIVYKGDKRVTKITDKTEAAVKRQAEIKYLRGTK